MNHDSQAVGEDVWRLLHHALRAFIRTRVPSKSDADDILQDVFTRVIEKSSTLRQADRLESWVYQIARNAIADFYRRRSPRPATPVEAADSALDVDTNHNLAVGAWLTKMLDQLPEKLQEAVRLYELEGLSQAAIAERLQISLSGTKSRIQRGRLQLEGLLRSCCELELDRRGNVLGCQPATPSSCSEASCGCITVPSSPG